jgi:hypothetical protein
VRGNLKKETARSIAETLRKRNLKRETFYTKNKGLIHGFKTIRLSG